MSVGSGTDGFISLARATAHIDGFAVGTLDMTLVPHAEYASAVTTDAVIRERISTAARNFFISFLLSLRPVSRGKPADYQYGFQVYLASICFARPSRPM